MKFKSLIWISGIALIALALVQYYFINETFLTKQQQFDSKYSSLAKLGIYDFDYNYSDYDYVEDSILNLLDEYAYYALNYFDLTADFESDSIYDLVINDFRTQLNSVKTKNIYLGEYFKAAGENLEFTTYRLLKEIQLLPFGEEVLFYSGQLTSMEEQEARGYLIKSYTIERNYYRLKYDYYVSFTNRAERIDREMILTKMLSLITLLIVFTVFFLTLRNLMIQKRLSDLKTDFINNMTHELKTPLSTISVASSSLSLPENKLTRERIREISGIIKKQNKHLSRLIDKILDISIWEKDQVRIERKELNAATFIMETIEDFNSIYPGTEINLHSTIPEDKSTFSLDEVHMTTVINNLLSNAVKYCNKQPVIEVSVSLGKKLVMEISDNGPGISKEDQKHVFEKFYRGKESKKKVIRGLGLGLYYVKQIVEAHNGTIILLSGNEGSTFKIEIPK